MGNGDNGVGINGKLTPRSTVLVAIVSSILGATGGPYLLVRVAPDALRPDPFTGQQGAALTARVAHLEDEMNSHLTRHPDLVNQFDRRITRLETQYEQIIANQKRILDRLNAN